MKVVIHTNVLRNIGLGLLLTINYMIEGFLLYLLIESIMMFPEYWGVIIFFVFLLLVRLGGTHVICSEIGSNSVKFNYHYYVIYELLKQVKKALNIDVEVKE